MRQTGWGGPGAAKTRVLIPAPGAGCASLGPAHPLSEPFTFVKGGSRTRLPLGFLLLHDFYCFTFIYFIFGCTGLGCSTQVFSNCSSQA